MCRRKIINEEVRSSREALLGRRLEALLEGRPYWPILRVTVRYNVNSQRPFFIFHHNQWCTRVSILTGWLRLTQRLASLILQRRNHKILKWPRVWSESSIAVFLIRCPVTQAGNKTASSCPYDLSHITGYWKHVFLFSNACIPMTEKSHTPKNNTHYQQCGASRCDSHHPS